jgi:hypothetical protein
MSMSEGQESADAVEKVGFEVIVVAEAGDRENTDDRASLQVAEVGAGIVISMASLRRLWAVAAR